MKLRHFSLVEVALAVVTAATPAMAFDPPTGSRLGSRFAGSIKYSEEQADDAATKMASCLVTKREAAARAYIDAYTADESDKTRNELFKDISCMSFINVGGMSDTFQVSFPRDVLRGKFAEALLKKRSDAIAALPALPLVKDYSRPWFAATGRSPIVDEMGACVADTNPKGAASILAANIYSKEEVAAFGALMSSLGTCLRAGAKLQANHQALRAALADALYQRLTKPAPTAQLAAAEARAQQGRVAFRKFAECVVNKNPQDAHVYVVEDLPEGQFTRLRNKMRDEGCWQASTGLQPPIITTGLKLQGMIAEALMARGADQGPLQQIGTIAPLMHERVTEADRKKSDPETLKYLIAMLDLFSAGECVVRADVNGSHALLRSGVASPQELAALGVLKSAFDGCSRMEFGYTVTPDELRAAVAVNYYRLAHAPRLTAASTGATK